MIIKKWVAILLILTVCVALFASCTVTQTEIETESSDYAEQPNTEAIYLYYSPPQSAIGINADGTRNEGFYGVLLKPLQARIEASAPFFEQAHEPAADVIWHFTHQLRVLGENPGRFAAEVVADAASQENFEIRQILDQAIRSSLKDMLGAAVYSSLTNETVLNGTENYYSGGMPTSYALLQYMGCEFGAAPNIRDAIWASGITWSLEQVDRSMQWVNTYVRNGQLRTTTSYGGLPPRHDYWVIARANTDILCADGMTIAEGTDLVRILIYCGNTVAQYINAGGLIAVNSESTVLVVLREASAGDFEYIIENNQATITRYIGSGGNVVIPSQIGGMDVTAIGSRAFYGCENLIVVVIPTSVAYIGEMAFYNCINLTVVYFIRIESVFISPDAFGGNDVLVIICVAGTPVHNFCVEHGIRFELSEATRMHSIERRQPQAAREHLAVVHPQVEAIVQPQTEAVAQPQTEAIRQPEPEVVAQPEIGGALQVAVGSRHTMAIRYDGSLWTWGANWAGELGDGTMEERDTPMKVMDDVVYVAAGTHYSMAIRSDGSLWTWGWNGAGQLGDGISASTRAYPVKVLDDVIKVHATNSSTLALRSDGSLWGWSRIGISSREHSSLPVRIMDDVIYIGGNGNGDNRTFVIRSDGSLWGWGSNTHGQLGDGTAIDRREPVFIMNDVKSVHAGPFHTLAITNNGSLWAWGHNGAGELGDGTTTNRRSPVHIMDNVRSAYGVSSGSLAITNDNSLWIWGFCSRYWGSPSLTPVKAMDGVARLGVRSSGHMAVIKNDGSLWVGELYGVRPTDDPAAIDHPLVMVWTTQQAQQ